jgi:hypothetical protein
MLRLLSATLLVWLLAGCGNNGNDSSINQGRISPAATTVFNITSGDIPYPNDILFAPNSSGNNDPDGVTLNIPYEDSDSDAGVKRALNALTGFSTISPITVGVTDELSDSSLIGKVHLYAWDGNTTLTPLQQYGLSTTPDYAASVSNGRLAIVLLKPLAGHQKYIVVLEKGIVNTDGQPLVADAITSMTNGTQPLIVDGVPTVYFDADAAKNIATATQLETLRQATQGLIALSGTQGIARENVIMAWTFTTQKIGEVQTALAGSTMTANLSLTDTTYTTKTFIPALHGIANIYFGTLSSLPQYMPQASAANPLPALTGEFTFTGSSALPDVKEANAVIPVLATVPNTASGCSEPPAGWPAVIYQHGITRQRSDLLAYAETFAAKCYAAIAIDLPLHGISDTTSPFYTGIERTFDIDLVTEDADYNIIAEVPDGIIDSTGAHYVNLANLPTTRDNLHQSTSDLLQLEHSLAAAAGVHFDTTRIHFVSHSLGNIAAIGYLIRPDTGNTGHAGTGNY